MKIVSILLLFLASAGVTAQELFVMTEPASNAPAGSIGVRVGQSLMENQLDGGSMYAVTPEVTWGVNKNFMVRASAFFSNDDSNSAWKGGGVYAKYRFFSIDDLQSHFRLAGFGRYSWNNSSNSQEVLDLTGGSSGYEAGLVATQLIKKVAISSSFSYVGALDNTNYDFPDAIGKNAVNYTLSVGRLMYPKRYTSFKETNINTMLEFVGQTITEDGSSYLDIVPSIQFIINSQARIDLAYKKELYSSMRRLTSDGVFLKLEYTFFNVTK